MAAQLMTLKEAQALAEKLETAPDLPAEQRRLSKKEVVAVLKPAIEKLREKGYTVDAIAAMLKTNGFDVTFGSLRQYLADRQGGRSRKKRGAVAAPAGAATPAAGGGVAVTSPANAADKPSATGAKSMAPPAASTPSAATKEKTGDKKGTGFVSREDTKDL